VAAGSESGGAGPLLHAAAAGALVARVAHAQLLVDGAGRDLADVVRKLDDVEQDWRKKGGQVERLNTQVNLNALCRTKLHSVNELNQSLFLISNLKSYAFFKFLVLRLIDISLTQLDLTLEKISFAHMNVKSDYKIDEHVRI
jgi:hypothetical protein